jgi:hypothetical protein
MLVAMKPNAPNQLNQFDRATVNRPPDAGAIRGLQGGEMRPHHSMTTVLALLFLVASFVV